MDIEQEILALQERNKKVTCDKSRETSATRKIAIALLTYTIVVLFFLYMWIDRPWQSAIVPTLGFLLSTLSLDLLKKYWITYFYARQNHVDENKK